MRFFSMGDKRLKSRVGDVIAIMREKKNQEERWWIASWVAERSCKLGTEIRKLFLASRKTFVGLDLMEVKMHSGWDSPRKWDSGNKYL